MRSGVRSCVPPSSSEMSDQLGRIVEQRVEDLAEPRGEPQPLDGGTSAPTSADATTSSACRARTQIDRAAERIANERAAEVGVAPPVAAILDDPQATRVEVEIFGEWIGGEVAREPLFDPEGERIRADG